MNVTDIGVRLTIEELAHESGMTVRNIRNHQSRGLLSPPEVVARVGYYGPDHVERLRLSREMQDDGFNLGAIKRLLQSSPGSAEQLSRFRTAIATPDQDEAPEVISAAELPERFTGDPRNVERAISLGVLHRLGDDKFEVPSRAMLRAAEEAVARGGSVRDSDEREERWAEVVEALERQRPVASETVVALFRQSLGTEMHAAFERELARQAKRKR